MRWLGLGVLALASTVRPIDAGCADWCTQYTCEQIQCSTCTEGCSRPRPPPPPPPKPPRPPPPPDAPMATIGVRAADFWTSRSSLYTNAFGSRDEPLRIKGASWFGLDSNPCIPGGASKGKVELGMAFLRRHGFNALRLPLAVDAIIASLRGQTPSCMAPDPGAKIPAALAALPTMLPR